MPITVDTRPLYSNRVHVLVSEKGYAHLPMTEINPTRSVHTALKRFMNHVFINDPPPHKPHGILSVGVIFLSFFLVHLHSASKLPSAGHSVAGCGLWNIGCNSYAQRKSKMSLCSHVLGGARWNTDSRERRPVFEYFRLLQKLPRGGELQVLSPLTLCQ